MTRRAVIVGAGVAGVAAALSARAAGYDPLVLSRGSGASALTSGALDWSPWSLAGSLEGKPPVLAPDARLELSAFWQELGFELGPRLLVTGAGILRDSAGADRFLLDLAALPESASIGVVQTNWQGDDSAALLRALPSDPRAAGRTFVAVAGQSLFSEAERRLPLAALVEQLSEASCERLVQLAAAASQSGIAALLVGPYLGLAPTAREVLGRAPIPIGETTSPPAGSAGRRLELRLSELLLRQGIAQERAWVTRLRDVPGGVEVTFDGSQGEGQRLEVDVAILASGGLVGGGLVLSSGAGQVLGSPLLEPVSDSGSFLGFDAAADGGSWLRPGRGPGLPPEIGGVRCVGDVRRGALQTLLAASRDGLSIFRR